MTKYKKDANGNYIIHGHKYEMLEGSRAQVMHGTAYKTSGELTKNDLRHKKSHPEGWLKRFLEVLPKE